MKRCYIVLGEPGRQFLGVHLTVDGAVHAAAGHGATSMPNGAPLYVDWTCLGKVESSLEVKGELNDEAATVHEGV